MATFRLSPRLGQWFTFEEFRYMDFIGINSALYHLPTEDLLIQRFSPPWERKVLLVSGKESETLKGIPAQ